MWKKRVVVACVFLTFLLFCLCSMLIGYVPSRDHNAQLIKANCIVRGHRIDEKRCGYRCSYGVCHTGFAKMEVLDVVRNVWVYIVTYCGGTSSYNTQNLLNRYWSINSTHLCYYNKTNPKNIYFFLEPEMFSYATGLVFIGFMGATVVGWTIVEVVWGVKRYRQRLVGYEKHRESEIELSKELSDNVVKSPDATTAE